VTVTTALLVGRRSLDRFVGEIVPARGRGVHCRVHCRVHASGESESGGSARGRAPALPRKLPYGTWMLKPYCVFSAVATARAMIRWPAAVGCTPSRLMFGPYGDVAPSSVSELKVACAPDFAVL